MIVSESSSGAIKVNDYDDEEEAHDIETLKARSFDDFKDDNPRGWGNRGGNIG